ncbi:Uncharacterised protein [Actinobacillus pleuropneumoniae]|nr:Uncharacterised protein [Actinobacillus pleuropneumoniae]
MMTHKEMIHIVQTQLAIDLNCTVDDLNGEKDRVIFVDARENPGRRPYPRKERYFEMLSMGKSIVVSATPGTAGDCQNAYGGEGQGYDIFAAVY